jgi:hypothetical protein
MRVKFDGAEGIRNIKYLWTVISNADGETREVKASIPAANKSYFLSAHHI